MPSEEGVNLGAARATLLELTCRLLLRELDEATVEALRHPDLLGPLRELEPEIEAYLNQPWDSQRFDEAASDYCALFVLAEGCPPCASAWLPGDASQRGAHISSEVDRWCELLQLNLAAGPWGRLPKDHLAISLGLLAHALHQPAPTGDALSEQILASLLRPWVSQFIAGVLDKTRNPLYRASMKLLELLLSNEQFV